MTPDQPHYEDDERRVLAMRWVVDQLDYARTEARKIVDGTSEFAGQGFTKPGDRYPLAYGWLESAVTSMITVLSDHLPAPYRPTDARA